MGTNNNSKILAVKLWRYGRTNSKILAVKLWHYGHYVSMFFAFLPDMTRWSKYMRAPRSSLPNSTTAKRQGWYLLWGNESTAFCLQPLSCVLAIRSAQPKTIKSFKSTCYIEGVHKKTDTDIEAECGTLPHSGHAVVFLKRGENGCAYHIDVRYRSQNRHSGHSFLGLLGNIAIGNLKTNQRRS